MITSSEGAGEYGGSSQTSEYTEVAGVLIVPRCKSGSQPKVVTIHDPYTIRAVKWSATRRNRPPVCPLPETSGNATYLGGTVAVPLPHPNFQEDSFNWSVSGQYTFLEATSKSVGDELPSGGLPYELGTADVLATQIIDDLGYSSAPASVIMPVLAGTVSHDTLFSWPFTFLPSTCGQSLIM